MAVPFQQKRTNVQGRVPTTSDLVLGQLAINTHDGKLFLKKDDGSESIVEIGGPIEGIEALSGTTPALSTAAGTIKTWTLSGNSTPTDSLSSGESVTLYIDDGAAHTITWPSVTWMNTGGTAPTLATSGYTVIVLSKVGSTLYGFLAGDGT
jgi:hypothetical protein